MATSNIEGIQSRLMDQVRQRDREHALQTALHVLAHPGPVNTLSYRELLQQLREAIAQELAQLDHPAKEE